MIIDHLLPLSEQRIVLIQEVKEHRCGDTFITIREAMVLCHEIQKIRCLFLQRRINFLPTEGLVDIADAALDCAKLHEAG